MGETDPATEAGQSKAGQGKAGQGKARRSEARQEEAGPYPQLSSFTEKRTRDKDLTGYESLPEMGEIAILTTRVSL